MKKIEVVHIDRKLVRYNLDGDIASYDFLAPNEQWYEIVVSECRTIAELTDWIAHMCDKTWVTTKHIQQFVILWQSKQPKRIRGKCDRFHEATKR